MTATSTRVGRFRFGAARERWWWSDHMFLIHGMQPGDVVPTRDLLLTHVQRDCRPMVAETLDRCLDEQDAYACDYSLVDMSGTAHHVVLAVAGDGDGDVSGFLVDVTAARDALLADRVNAELTVALESHAAIDQAKGILMLVYGVGEDTAFEILKQSSQRHNTRLRELARRVVEVAADGWEATTSERLDEALCGTPPVQPSPQRPRHLDLRTECTGRETLLRVSGSVDLSNSDELADAVSMAMLAAADHRRVTVDVRDVGRVGPAMVDVLTAALRRSSAHGITLTIVGGGRKDSAESTTAHRSVSSRS